MEWLWDTFGLITPAAFTDLDWTRTKNKYGTMFKLKTGSQKSMNFATGFGSSIPCQSIQHMILWWIYGKSEYVTLSLETYQNIYDEYDENNYFKDEEYDRDDIEHMKQAVNQLIINEDEMGVESVDRKKIGLLFNGIFIAGNWKWLSDSDLTKFAQGWGIAINIKPRNRWVPIIISSQNSLFPSPR